jgi:hypothetical protein
MFRLINRRPRGDGQHRDGWPAVVHSLHKLSSDDGMLLDDFIEQSIDEDRMEEHMAGPWVGIFHHPRARHHPDPNKRTLPQHFLKREELAPAWRNLQTAITLSQDLARLLRELLPNTHVVALKHPVSGLISRPPFDQNALRVPKLRLVQVGTYMRNIRGIFQVPASPEWDRLRTWIPPYYESLDAFLSRIAKEEYRGVTTMPKLTDVAYDSMLSRSVVFVNYFDASASNTVLECMQRGTPIILNRLPAHEEYLGRDYPGFYSDVRDVPNILFDRLRLMDASRYLENRQKTLISVPKFCAALTEQFRRFVKA